MPHILEMDCPPGNPRPGDLLPSVLQGTGLKVEDFTELGRCFGNWTWEVKEEKDDLYVAQREVIASRIKKLYHDGYIRWGKW